MNKTFENFIYEDLVEDEDTQKEKQKISTILYKLDQKQDLEDSEILELLDGFEVAERDGYILRKRVSTFIQIYDRQYVIEWVWDADGSHAFEYRQPKAVKITEVEL